MRTDWTGSGGSANAYTASARLCIDCATSTATIPTIIDAPRVIAVVLEVFGGLGGDVTWPTFCFTQQLGYLSPDRLRHRLRPRKWSATSNISLSMFSSTFGSCVVVSDCQQARIASCRSFLDASLSPVFSLRPVCCSGSMCIAGDKMGRKPELEVGKIRAAQVRGGCPRVMFGSAPRVGLRRHLRGRYMAFRTSFCAFYASICVSGDDLSSSLERSLQSMTPASMCPQAEVHVHRPKLNVSPSPDELLLTPQRPSRLSRPSVPATSTRPTRTPP